MLHNAQEYFSVQNYLSTIFLNHNKSNIRGNISNIMPLSITTWPCLTKTHTNSNKGPTRTKRGEFHISKSSFALLDFFFKRYIKSDMMQMLSKFVITPT